jgi:hypothetical protein
VHWPLLILFLCLIALTRWNTKRIQGIGYLVSQDGQIALVLYFVLILPGVITHELSHALTAWFLRVKVRHLSIGIRRKGNSQQVALGSVDISRTDPVRASLIGLAPLIFGCGAIWYISGRVLGVRPILPVSLPRLWTELQIVYTTPDFWLWAYLVFAISNAMLPSAADRQSWGTALILIAFIGALIYFSGLFDALSGTLTRWLNNGASQLTLAFAVTVAVDLVFAVVLWIAEQLLALLGFGRLEYR